MHMKKTEKKLDLLISEAQQKETLADTDGIQKKIRKGVMRGNKEQISLTFPPEMISKIDEAADDLGISRSAWISMTISIALKKSRD
jgi:hypothetical protein